MRITLKESSQTSKLPVARQPRQKYPEMFQLKQYPSNNTCQQLALMLIRPPRFLYNPDIIRPRARTALRFTSQTFNIGFELTLYKQRSMRYAILYLHGNGSSRFQGFQFLSSLPDGVGLACFDFNGCGNREESQYITLGQKESQDVDKAARHLKQLGYLVVGWGRSMGAVSLLTSSECDIMVADSAFSNLARLCKETSSKLLPNFCCCVFHIFFPCVFCCIKRKVENMSGLQIQRMNPVEQMKKWSFEKEKSKKSICFIHGQQDTLIGSKHSQTLYESFDGRKMIVIFQGTHNSSRPREVLDKCFQFIQECLEDLIDSSLAKNENIKLTKLVQLQHMSTKMFDDKKSCKKGEQQQISQTDKQQGIYVDVNPSDFHNTTNKKSSLTHPTLDYTDSALKTSVGNSNLTQNVAKNILSFQNALKQQDEQVFPTIYGENAVNQVKRRQTVQRMFLQK